MSDSFMTDRGLDPNLNPDKPDEPQVAALEPDRLEPKAEAPAPQVISDGAWSSATSTWISAHVRNSPIAQSVEAWTHLGTILPHLRGYLENELKSR